MKMKIYRITFALLIIALIIVLGLIVIKYGGNQIYERKNDEIIEVFNSSTISEDENNQIEMEGYTVIGIVRIPKINLEYPILDIDNPNPSKAKDPMRISIVKYWGENVNDYGNLSIAGHNNKDGTMFGKTKKLEIGDIVELVDLNKNTIQYKVYEIFITEPNDVSILETKDENVREVTLITCTNGNKNRLIVKAREI